MTQVLEGNFSPCRVGVGWDYLSSELRSRFSFNRDGSPHCKRHKLCCENQRPFDLVRRSEAWLLESQSLLRKVTASGTALVPGVTAIAVGDMALAAGVSAVIQTSVVFGTSVVVSDAVVTGVGFDGIDGNP